VAAANGCLLAIGPSTHLAGQFSFFTLPRHQTVGTETFHHRSANRA
jgi:hypothetical protein